MSTINLCVVGSGPSSLLAVLEAGLLNMRCHVISGFDHEEISLAELSPSDIGLTAILMEQIREFEPVFYSGERIKNINHEGGAYHIVTDRDNKMQCRSLVVVV